MPKVNMELRQFNGWIDKEPDQVLNDAAARLKRGGWDDVRPALSITVRWVFLVAQLPNYMNASDLYCCKDIFRLQPKIPMQN